MGHERRLRTRTVIFAGVRFGPMLFEASSSVPITFRHIEVGIRIEQPADGFFLDGETQLDPKLKFDHIGDDASVRTFCCCRGGEVIKTSTLGIWSVSGRADGPKTSRSNVGFNVRLTNEIHATQIWSGLRKRMSALTLLPTPEELDKFIAAAEGSSGTSPIVELLGSDISRLLASGLRQAQHSHPLLRSGNAVVWAPTVEGIGFYPRVDSGLRVLPGLWVAGDATGVFRGLTASMVSGYYCGLQAQNLGG
jgi:uncharacterized FAD-dependent dehydrogenase